MTKTARVRDSVMDKHPQTPPLHPVTRQGPTQGPGDLSLSRDRIQEMWKPVPFHTLNRAKHPRVKEIGEGEFLYQKILLRN